MTKHHIDPDYPTSITVAGVEHSLDSFSSDTQLYVDLLHEWKKQLTQIEKERQKLTLAINAVSQLVIEHVNEDLHSATKKT